MPIPTSPGPYRLCPGVVRTRRDDHHLQIGIDPPGRVIVPDTDEIRQLLARLVDGIDAPPQTWATRRAFDDLVSAGMVSPAEATPSGGVRLEGPSSLTTMAAGLLGDAVSTTGDITLLLEPGLVPRSRTDPYLRSGHPHLSVSGSPDAWTVGPFVVPGVTACQRCVDATLADRDPRRPLVLEQATRHPTRPLADPLLAATAVPWAVRDALAYLRGDTPLTWSATLTIPHAGEPVVTSWRRHPHCGCAWDAISIA